MNGERILCVEDDESIRELILYALRGSGFEAQGVEGGSAMQDALERQRPDLVLLDIMLPGEDGLKLLKQLRQSARYTDLPVILLTARTTEYDKVVGLDTGADDYIAKPFGVMELISRINAVLRRSGRVRSADTLRCGEIEIDTRRREVRVEGEQIALTFKEFELLQYLVANKGVVLSRSRIMSAVWGFDFEGESRTVEMHIKTLRQKLGAHAPSIETVRGVGYRMGG